MTIKPGDYQFTCPQCESHYYSSTITVGNKLARNCNGTLRFGKYGADRKCLFAWHEDEDWKYFTFVVRFKDRQEHDFYWRMYRNTLEDMINGQEESQDRESKTGTEEEGGCSADFPCSSCSCFGTP